MAEKLRGTKVWIQTPGVGGPGASSTQIDAQRPGWVLGAGESRPLPLPASRGITPWKFLKTQMLNPAFWWLLCLLLWNVLPFKNYGQEVGIPILCWSPYGCCAYAAWILRTPKGVVIRFSMECVRSAFALNKTNCLISLMLYWNTNIRSSFVTCGLLSLGVHATCSVKTRCECFSCHWRNRRV